MASLPIETVLDMARSIPCSPSILPSLLSLIQQPDIEIHAVERLIRADTALTTSVLRLANSAYYGRARKFETVEEAMLRLGSYTVYRVAATAAAGRWLSHSVQGYGWEPGDLARHSLAVGIAAEVLCQLTGANEEAELAYTAGLIHDVGKLAMAYANFVGLTEVERRLGANRQSWRELEREVIGYDAAEVSRLLLLRWGFPTTLVAVGAYYTQPRRAEEGEQKLVALVHAAKHLALQLGFGVGADGYYCEVDEAILEAHGFTEMIFEAALPQILTRLQPFIGADGLIQIAN